MPEREFENISSWAQGVITSAAPNQLPPGASPRGHNTFLTQIGEGTALMGKRAGERTLNSIPITGAPGLIGGFQFKKKNLTNTELLVSDTGRLDKLNSDGTTTVINASAFTAGVHYPIFAVANDLCFIVNDVDQKKYDGTTLTAFGITRPAAPTAAVAAGGAMVIGTYDVALTYYNSLTGNESSLSDFTTVTTAGANLQINVSWLAPADPQVTHVRVYIRFQSQGANTYQVVAGATPAPAANGFPVATTATVLNISLVQYSAFIIIAPGVSENNPPLTGAQYPVWHNSRLFLADSGNIYYSNIKNNAPFPEAFNTNNVQPVNPNDGDRIVGLFSAFGRLFIFKRFSLWQLVGTDPNSWFVSLVSNAFGLSSMRSLVFVEGALFWWSGSNGLVAYDGSGPPISLGKQFLASTIAADTLNHTALTSVSAVADVANQMLLFAVPELGGTRNTRIIPFNYRLKRFSADLWNPFDIYSLWQVEDTDQLTAVHVGNYGGQAFKWWTGTNDGVPTSDPNVFFRGSISDTPLGYWRMDAAAGPTETDRSAGGHNGTIVGGVTLNQTGALLSDDSDTAMLFNGTTGYVTMGNQATLGPTGAFTAKVWAKFTATGALKPLVGKLQQNVANGWGILEFSGSGAVQFYAANGGVPLFDFHTDAQYNDGVYHLIHCVFDGTTNFGGATIYIDGALVKQATPTGTTLGTTTDPFVIGSFGTLSTGFFGGTIDEVGLYAGAFTAAQVAADFARRNPSTTSTNSGTVTAGAATTLTDVNAVFSTTAGALNERYVYHIATSGAIQRRRITSNTVTKLTVTPAWDTALVAGDTYVVGGIDWQLDTPWMLGASVFVKKRFEFLLAQAASLDANATVMVDLFVSLDDTVVKRSLRFSLTGAAGVLYDAPTSIYDSSLYAAAATGSTYSKMRCGTVGRSWRARFRNIQAGTTVLINGVGMQSVPMSIKH